MQNTTNEKKGGLAQYIIAGKQEMKSMATLFKEKETRRGKKCHSPCKKLPEA